MWFSVFALFAIITKLSVASLPNVTFQLNPGCTKDCSSFNVFHMAARYENYSTHFLLTASDRIVPSVLALYSSDPDASVDINWELVANSTETPVKAFQLRNLLQSYATVLTRLIDYDDLDDRADVSRSPPGPEHFMIYPLNNLHWNLTTHVEPGVHKLEHGQTFDLVFAGNASDPVFGSDGLVKLVFTIGNTNEHNERMPGLQFLPGLSVQFELHLLQLVSRYTQGRFAVQLALVSQDSVASGEDFAQSSVISINDEVSPGIFEIVNIRLGERVNHSTIQSSTPQHPGAFLQARPVCYISEGSRDVKNSRDARLAPTRDPVSPKVLARSLPFYFYGDGMRTVGLRLQNVSFGTPDDKYYAASKCIIWSASFGFGEPPIDSISVLLIGIISLAVIVVLGSLLLGTLLLLVGRFRPRRSPGTEPLLGPTETMF